jgi:hypothetical protein
MDHSLVYTTVPGYLSYAYPDRDFRPINLMIEVFQAWLRFVPRANVWMVGG